MTDAATQSADLEMLDRAARAGMRGLGMVEPNPPVGCVIGRRRPEGSVEIFAVGHHRRVGGPHAEIDALGACRLSGRDPAGATVWVTLEPCAHLGRTPSCAEALIEAGVAEVVYAAPDPHPQAAGGAGRLRAAGVRARECQVSASALALCEPFIHRMRTGRPWVIAKWAQTLDGRVAARTGESQWISGRRARLDVHRLRARVDAVITGAGTVRADDPMLTARSVRRVRRRALRIIVDPDLTTPFTSRLMRTIEEAPVMLWCRTAAHALRAAEHEHRGAVVLALPEHEGRLDLRAGLETICTERGVSTALVEAGPGLTGDLADRDLIDEVRAYIAPRALADGAAFPIMRGRRARALGEAAAFRLMVLRRLGPDALLVWRRTREDRPVSL